MEDFENATLPLRKLITPTTIIVGTTVVFSIGVLGRLAYDWSKEGINSLKTKKISQ